MQLPMPIHWVADALPHRPPMIWIDEILAADATSGLCRIHHRPTSLAVRDGQETLTFAPIEWMAQAFGYSQAAWKLLSRPDLGAPPLKRAFLAGISDFSLQQKIPCDTPLLVSVQLFRQMTPMALVDGAIRSESSGDVLAKGRLKLFFEQDLTSNQK